MADLSLGAGDAWQHQALVSVGGDVLRSIGPIPKKESKKGSRDLGVQSDWGFSCTIKIIPANI